MISEGSCDTEDWSNDAENSALHHRNKNNTFKLCYKKNTAILNFNNIYCFYRILNQINAAFLRIRLLSNTVKNLTSPTLLNGSIYKCYKTF